MSTETDTFGTMISIQTSEISAHQPTAKMNTSTMKKSGNGLISLELLYADNYCIGLHKAPGIPCQSRHPGPPTPLDQNVNLYLNEDLKLWTRIDQPVSGIVLFRRAHNTARDLTIGDKTYLAIVEGKPENELGTLQTRIRRDGRKMKAVVDLAHGKPAKLSYSVLHRFDHYTLLLVRPRTGRFHQIRFQLAQAGWPVKGDVKYGARRKNTDRSIHLHAYAYEIRPKEGEPIVIRDITLPKDPLWDLVRPLLRQSDSGHTFITSFK